MVIMWLYFAKRFFWLVYNSTDLSFLFSVDNMIFFLINHTNVVVHYTVHLLVLLSSVDSIQIYECIGVNHL